MFIKKGGIILYMNISILSCGVFEPELNKILDDIDKKKLFEEGININVKYLPFGLHTNLNKLKNVITNNLDNLKSDKIILLYGSKCHYMFHQFLKPYTNLITFQDSNCIELILEDKKDNEIVDYTINIIKEVYKSREDLIGSEAMRDWERKVILHFVDNYWIDHIDAIEQLKKGIGLLAAGQKDPVKEFTVQSFDMFDDINKNINKDALKHLFA